MARVIADIPRVEKMAVCRGCGHTIAYVMNEVKSETSRDYTGCSDTEYYVSCPSRGCGKKVYVRGY